MAACAVRCASMVSARSASGSLQCVSQPCWETSNCGWKAASNGGTTAWNARSQAASRVPGGRATLTADPSASGPPVSVGLPGTGEQARRVLVQADRQDARVVPERRLHPVAVVHVDVDVRDPLGALAEQPRDRDRGVVVDAEAAGVRRASRGAGRRRCSRRAVPRLPTSPWPPPASRPRPGRMPRACARKPGRRWCRGRASAGARRPPARSRRARPGRRRTARCRCRPDRARAGARRRTRAARRPR